MPTEAGRSSGWSAGGYLREVQYANPSNLNARAAIYAYQQPHVDWYDWVLDLVSLTGGETILDVGCGPGAYLAALRRRGHRGLAVGLDFSAGMLAAARSASGPGPLHPVVQSDAAALAVASAGVDVAMAMHMLYHVPDPRLALAELRRVTRAGGTTLIVLNAPGHCEELRSLMHSASAAVGTPRSVPELLDLPAGMVLAREFFTDVRPHEVRAQLVVPEPAPVLAYVGSMISVIGAPDGDALLAEAERIVSETIAAEGAFRVHTASGCLVCR